MGWEGKRRGPFRDPNKVEYDSDHEKGHCCSQQAVQVDRGCIAYGFLALAQVTTSEVDGEDDQADQAQVARDHQHAPRRKVWKIDEGSDTGVCRGVNNAMRGA